MKLFQVHILTTFRHFVRSAVTNEFDTVRIMALRRFRLRFSIHFFHELFSKKAIFGYWGMGLAWRTA